MASQDIEPPDYETLIIKEKEIEQPKLNLGEKLQRMIDAKRAGIPQNHFDICLTLTHIQFRFLCFNSTKKIDNRITDALSCNIVTETGFSRLKNTLSIVKVYSKELLKVVDLTPTAFNDFLRALRDGFEPQYAFECAKMTREQYARVLELKKETNMLKCWTVKCAKFTDTQIKQIIEVMSTDRVNSETAFKFGQLSPEKFRDVINALNEGISATDIIKYCSDDIINYSLV